MAFHFIGIKGTGMAALAGILHDEHFEVKGSDIEKYIFTQDGLEERGIPFTTFDAANIQDGDQVIIGLSFGPDHPEVKAALENPTVKTWYYNDYLQELLARYCSICIAGTHGKSTTTGLLASILEEDRPTGFLIGDGHGHMPDNAETFILESCEFQRHFLAYHPDYALITNIELDHIDYYKDMEDYISAFQAFADQVKKGIVYCADDPYLKDLDYSVPAISYGLEQGDYQARNVQDKEDGVHFEIWHDSQCLARLDLPESGYPFIINSTGAFAMAHHLGEPADKIVAGLEKYHGINRRFSVEEAAGRILIDDYAHHPTAIGYMIDACRHRWPGKKIIALFKPDRYSRLQYFLDRFAQALNQADEAAVLDFAKNAVREDETITVTIQDLLDRLDNGTLLDISPESAKWLADREDAVYLFMSSKDIYLLKDLLKEQLIKNEQ